MRPDAQPSDERSIADAREVSRVVVGGLLVQHASWRWVFYVNLPIGLAALTGLRLRLPAADTGRPDERLDASGAALLAGATAAFTLVCVWGGTRYAWSSGPRAILIAAVLVLSGGLALRERRAAEPIVPVHVLSTRTVAAASAALFLATAALFAITVFVPLFLQTTTRASPTQAGLLMVPMMAGITVSTTLAGRSVEHTGRYKRCPIAGLVLMTISLALLAALAGDPSRVATGIGLVVFGPGFGMVTQILIVAVQNAVERRDLGIAMATTSFFRGLGGAAGAAILGAVFAARADTHATETGLRLGAAARADVVDAVQSVFVVAAPLAAVALIAALMLPEVPLRSRRDAPQSPGAASRSSRATRVPAGASR